MIDHKAALLQAEDNFKNKNGDLMCYAYLDLHRLAKEYFHAVDHTSSKREEAESTLRAAIGE